MRAEPRIHPTARVFALAVLLALAVLGAGLVRSPGAVAATVTPAAPSFVDDTCNNFLPTGASYTIPSTTGVDYLVNGVVAPAGSYGAADGATVTVVAQAQSGFALTGTATFTHTFSPAPSCTTHVAPTAPTFTDDACSGTSPAGASYTIPATAGVDYLVNGIKTAAGTYPATDGSTVKVTTRAQAGFSLTGTTSFTHTFAATPDCSAQRSRPLRRPSRRGRLLGRRPDAGELHDPVEHGCRLSRERGQDRGRNLQRDGRIELTITAQAQTGFSLTGVTSFTHTFAGTPSCLTQVTAAPPSFAEAACSNGARSRRATRSRRARVSTTS